MSTPSRLRSRARIVEAAKETRFDVIAARVRKLEARRRAAIANVIAIAAARRNR